MRDLIVTAETHPTLFRAFEVIGLECGFGDGYTNYGVPEKWTEACNEAEPALAALTPAEFEAFCTGRDSLGLVALIIRKGSSPALLKAHHLLKAFYKDFEED